MCESGFRILGNGFLEWIQWLSDASNVVPICLDCYRMLMFEMYMMYVIEYGMRYGWLWLELDAAARDAKGAEKTGSNHQNGDKSGVAVRQLPPYITCNC